MAAWTPSIPGIDLDIAGDQRCRRAVEATMAYCDAHGLLSEIDAAQVMNLLVMAETIDRAVTTRGLTVALSTQQRTFSDALREFREGHAPQVTSEAAWDAIVADLSTGCPVLA